MRIMVCLCLALLVVGNAVSQDIAVRPGDTLNVAVLGESDLSGKFIVRDDGTIALPMAGELHVEGLTPSAIARSLSERLAEYVKDPQVTVQIIEHAPVRVVISGAVRSPGVYFVPSDSHVAEALAVAGGATPAADLSAVLLARAGDSRVLDFRRFLDAGDGAQNPLLVSGDTVRVAEVSPELSGARVIGKVMQPGTYQVRDSITPWDLITQAGGLAPGANPQQAVLKPRVGDPQVVDLTALLQPQAMANAPLIRPGDTLVVPGLTTQVYVLGGVGRPGPYYVQEGARLLEAIAEAGGVTEFAVLDQAYLVRAAAGQSQRAVREPLNLRKLLIDGDMSLNVELHAGDALFIPVRSPGSQKRPFLERAAPLLAPLLYLLL